MLDGSKWIEPGDAVIGLASSGLHTNGYSLARKIFFEDLKLAPGDYVPDLSNTIGAELLKVHVSYGPLVGKLLQKFNARNASVIKGLAHITGGGFIDNIPRVLPRNCDVVIRKGSWEMLPIFKFIEEKSGVPDAELYQVFNMGIGMTVICAAEKATAVQKLIAAEGHRAWVIGGVVKG